MSKKSKAMKVLKFVLFAVLCVGTVFSYLNIEAFGKNPKDGYTIANISYICSDNNGGKVVIDSSGYEVVHINANGLIEAVIGGESTAEDGFYFANSVCCDADGNIYIHSKELSEESSFSISRECIKKFSPTGEYISTVADIHHEKRVMKCSIVRMQFTDEGLCYYTLTGSGVTMNIVGKNPEIFKYKDASVYVRDALYSEEDSSLYLITYNGIIGKIKNGDKAFSKIYNAPKTDKLSIPWYMSFGGDGTLYVTDLGFRTINTLTDDGYNCYYFNYEITDSYDPELLADSYIQYVADASDGFMTVNSDEIIWEENGEIQVESTFFYSHDINVSVYVFWISAVLAAAALLFFLVLGVIRIIKSDSGTVRMSVIVIALTFAVAGLFIGLTFGNFNDRLLQETHDRENSIALALNNTLPKSSFLALNELSAYNGKDYKIVKQSIENLLLDDNGNAGDLYCQLYSINDGVITLRYTLEEAYGINYPYDWEYEDSDEQHIITTGEKMFYSSLDNSEGNFMFILNPLLGDDGSVIGLVEIGTDLTAFSEANSSLIRDLLINILVMSIVIIMIAIEVIAFANSRKKFRSLLHSGDRKLTNTSRANMMRIVVFLVFFVTNITTCFLSYYALTLAQESGTTFLNLPPEILAAFPISAEVLTGALFSLFGTFFIKKFGRRGSGIIGGVLFTAGLCIRFIRPDLLMLTVGNAVQGCGWGIVLLIINTMIAEESDESSVQEGFVNYNAALQNGMNSGIVFGGFLIHWMSYRSILIFAAGLSVFVLIFSALYFTKEKLSEAENNEVKRISLIRFLFKPRILLYFVGIVIPVIAAGYYLNYLYPIIGEQLGMNETYLGYSYLLNGLAIMCFGNIIVKKLSRRVSKPVMLLLASVIYFAAFALVGRYQNIPVLLIALVVLGISDSFGYATQTSYYSELKEVKSYGYSRSMGVYSLFENFSQTAGSFLFGYVLVIGLEKGLLVFGAVIAVLAVIFCLSSLIGRRKIKSSISAAEKDEKGVVKA